MYASTTPGVLPGAYNKLAEIGMKRIPKHKLPETKPSKVQTNTATAGERTEAANEAQGVAQNMQNADAQESPNAESEAQRAE